MKKRSILIYFLSICLFSCIDENIEDDFNQELIVDLEEDCDERLENDNKFQYINTGVDLSNSVGEAFHGLATIGDWLMQAPQDHHSLVFYNTVSKEVKELDVSMYVRAKPSSGANHRDKFNGAIGDGERYIWVAPSWTTHALKIDIETFRIVQDFKVNSNFNDAYNGIILTEKYVWLVTHSKEDLPRINRLTGELKIFELKEEEVGDYHFGNGASNRAFFGGSNNFDGHIFLHPRRSKYIVKVNEESGKIVSRYKHPFANEKNPGYGYFHGASNVNGKLFFAPWAYKKVLVFNIETELFDVVDLEISGDYQFNFCSATDGNSVWFPPFRSSQIVKINTFTQNIEIIDAGEMIQAHLDGRFRASLDVPSGFAGASLVKDSYVWFSSSFESSYIKMPVKFGDLIQKCKN